MCLGENEGKGKNSSVVVGVLSLQKTKVLGFTRCAQPSYSLNVAPCEFFLFDYLKKELDEKNFRSQNAMTSVMRAILTEIPLKCFQESLTNGSGDCTSESRIMESTSK
jgi:hypothetical protein